MSKRTYQPNNRHRHKKHGFISRMKSSGGQSVIRRRRQKGRRKLAA